MFQMDCSKCRGVIKSPDLVELQVINCPQCEAVVQVKNVTVSARDFSSGFRSSLKNILLAAKDKFRLNKSKMVKKQEGYEVNKRLAKLLRRDDFRLDMSFELYVEIIFEEQKRLAKLLNISSEGAGLEFADRTRTPEKVSNAEGPLPGADTDIYMQLPLPGDKETLLVPGKVVWSRVPPEDAIFPSTVMGVRFRDINKKTRTCLWDFIVESETTAH